MIYDVAYGHKIQYDLNEKISKLTTEIGNLSYENFELKDSKQSLTEQRYANAVLMKEIAEAQTEVARLKKVCESWCKSAKLTTQCVNSQIPRQVQAVIGGDYKLAA